ncbi:MAG: CNNM domain-containing protein, partial [Planctomycetota bacterium]|nr:CNNM domain-containing protein [Planctomycetota bacterium]
MMWLAVGLFLSGLLLSAFFSGSETGFYRVPRIRLLIDSLAGDRVSRVLLWLTNYPSLFVATTL